MAIVVIAEVLKIGAHSENLVGSYLVATRNPTWHIPQSWAVNDHMKRLLPLFWHRWPKNDVGVSAPEISDISHGLRDKSERICWVFCCRSINCHAILFPSNSTEGEE